MAHLATILPGSSFSAPADDDGVIYTLNADRSVSADGMITMTADEAVQAFPDSDLVINAMHNTRHCMADYRPLPAGVTVKA